MNLESEVLKLAQEVLDDQNIQIDSQRSTSPTWDSLRHAELLIAVEDRFSVSFSSMELSSVDSVEAILQLLEDHGIPRL